MADTSEEFDLSAYPADGDKKKFEDSHSIIGFWIPDELKEKYDRIQKRSGEDFGRRLKNRIISEIKNVKE